MFTDMVGYTALGQKNESLSLALVEEQKKLVRPILGRHNGREVKTMGDAFLVEFPNALDSVRCAYDIQRVSREFNISQPSESRVRLRIGLHLGDVEESNGDIFGDAVNVASRIEPFASDGGICLTQQVRDQVVDKFDLPLVSIGKKLLKNVVTPREIYMVELPWHSKEDFPTASRKNRIAVLPFTSLSPDPQDEYFADGMTEELISNLSKLRDTRVIARTSIMHYKDTTATIREIGRELGVQSIIEGSVRKSGNNVRIAIQLIDSNTEEHLWADTYDKELADIFNVHSEVAANVANALKVAIPTAAPEKQTEKTEAYTYFLRGRYFWNRGSLDAFLKALDQFERAIEKDPTYAQAYAGLADTHLLMGRHGYVLPKAAYPKALQFALKAIDLDSRLVEAHVALAAIRQEHEWKWEESGKEFKRALELNPSYATAHGWYALYLGHLGRFEEGISEAQRAQELDPLSPRIHCNASEEYLFARQYDKAIEAAERALEIDPNYGGARGYRAFAFVEKRMFDEAIIDFQEADRLRGGRASLGRLGHVYAISGRLAEARKILDGFVTGSSFQPLPESSILPLPPPPSTAFDMGLVYLGLGEKEQAIEWLDKASDERTPEIIHVKCEPIYDSIRDEPKFRALLKKVGLE
jgi:TolB-like protein